MKPDALFPMTVNVHEVGVLDAYYLDERAYKTDKYFTTKLPIMEDKFW